jgi:hypothetical protein
MSTLPKFIDAAGIPRPSEGVVIIPLSVQPGQTLAHDTPADISNLSTVILQVSGLSVGDTLTVSQSIDLTNYIPVYGIAQDFSISPTITSDGIYTYNGGGSLRYSKSGTGQPPAVTIRAGA